MAINYSAKLREHIDAMVRSDSLKITLYSDPQSVQTYTFPTGPISISLSVDGSEYEHGGMEETDPLDDLLNAAGVGKEAGLPKHRRYIERTIEFEEAQKQSREKIAEAMASGEKWTESELEYKADPRAGSGRYSWVQSSPIFSPPWLTDPDPVPPAATIHDINDFFDRISSSAQSIMEQNRPVFDELTEIFQRMDLDPDPLPEVTDMSSALERKKMLNERKAHDNNRKGWKH